jgi:hypothetical protein
MRGRKLEVEREGHVGADGFKSGIGGDIIILRPRTLKNEHRYKRIIVLQRYHLITLPVALSLSRAAGGWTRARLYRND